MKHYDPFLALVAGLGLFAAACEEYVDINEQYRPVGSEIVFSAASEYNNGVETRTEYSGQTESVTGYTNEFERIDWVANDPITVSYYRGSVLSDTKNYTVSAGTANSERSDASLTGSNGKLYWSDGSGDHVFNAMYPNSTKNNSAVLTGNQVQEAMKSVQTLTHKSGKTYTPDMNYAYMVAREVIGESSSDRTVTLHFTPAMTAFRFKFKLKTGDAPATVTGFRMFTTGPYLAGTYLNTITGGTGETRSITWGTETINGSIEATSKEISVSFGSGVALSTSEFLDFTLFTLPVNIPNLTIEFTYSGGATKTLELKHGGNWVTFAPYKKYIITNDNVPGNEVWTYYVEDISDINTYGHLATPNLPFTVKSYRKNGSGTYEAVKWKVQYSTSASGPWSDTQPSGWQTNGAKFSITNTSGNGSLPSSSGEANSANILRDHNTSSSEYETDGAISDTERAAIATMKARGSLPSTTSDSGDGYFDLSKHPIYPVSAIDGAETTQETANCYVITRPGYYKFPLVYGNAINYNAPTATSGDNTMAYAPQGTSVVNDIVYYLRRFVRHDDKPITDPWIHNNGFTVADAVVVWQDVADASMQIVLDSDISISNNYVKFQVREANIRPGNVLIAARNSSGTILWSWHIWLTEKDLGPHTVVDGAGNTLQMMNFNLGWTDKVSGHGEHWVDWPFYIRIIQTDASGNILNNSNPQNVDNTGAADVFSVTQYGESISVKGNVGSNTFYQWGRKDPILPAASNNTNKAIYSAAYPLSSIIDQNVNNKVITNRDDNGTIGQTIQIPYNIFYSRQSQTIATQNGNITNSNHLFIGKATNNSGGTLAGAAWYGNLWDTGLIAHVGSSGDNAVSVNNRLPIKSVYDPSPRGYVVPYIFAFTRFSNGAYNLTDYSSPNGSLASSGEGYNFNDGNGGTIYLPFAGARGGDGQNPLYDVNATMYYWTTGKLPWNDKWGSNHKSKRMAFFRNGHMTTSPEMYGQSDEYSEGAYSIRPVLQTAY